MYCEVFGATVFGLSAYPVRVEVDAGPGLPCFEMSGYLNNEVREARERVKIAIKAKQIADLEGPFCAKAGKKLYLHYGSDKYIYIRPPFRKSVKPVSFASSGVYEDEQRGYVFAEV